MKSAAQRLALPTDNDETKLRKLYLAVQAFENTDLSQGPSDSYRAFYKRTVEDNDDTIWTARRGNSEELALLFIALARAAGYDARPMAVASRNRSAFRPELLSFDQLNATVAIVKLNRREIFFDPGVRMCPFAQMSPEHGNVLGVTTEATDVKIRATPAADYTHHRTDRTAELNLAPDGSVTGRVTIVWTGNAGLAMRQDAVRLDAHAVEVASEQQLQEDVPEGVHVKLVSLTGLGDLQVPVKATFAIGGKLGNATGKRLIIPEHFFASRGKRILMPDTRTMPIAFPAANVVRDRTVVVLPAELSVEALPQSHAVSVNNDAVYETQLQSGANDRDQTLLVSQRTLLLKRIDYKVEEYASLHKYFGDVASGDAEQIVLKSAAASASTAAKPGTE